MFQENITNNTFIEIFTGEDVDISVTRFIAKMSGDIRRFDQLNQCIACFVSISKMNDLWVAVCFHIDALYQIYCEITDPWFARDDMFRTSEQVRDRVNAPGHTMGWIKKMNTKQEPKGSSRRVYREEK